MDNNITGKIVFDTSVEFTTFDAESNKFFIYYRKDGELIKHELPLNLIEDFIYIDKNENNKCPICNSLDVISPELINPLKPPKMEDEDIVYFDGVSDPKNWECLTCGANNLSLKMKEPEIIPNFAPRYIKPKEVYDNMSGTGNLRFLKINGKRYREVLHWFKIPRGLSFIIKDIFKSVMPIFKYYEKDYYIYLEYIWYLDGKQHKPAISDHLIDDCRVCDERYLKPPKHFNRTILKYKYPNMWNLIDAPYTWRVEGSYVKFQIKWSKKKYYKAYMDTE